MKSSKIQVASPIILFLASFGAYIYTMCPTISTGDSGEFCAASVILGLPHSPGYPLYCLLGKIFTLIIPFGNLAYRVNLISVFFAVLTIVILAKIIEGLSNPSPDLRSPLPQPEVGYSSKERGIN